MNKKNSAGLLMYKIKNGKSYYFLGKSGGPYWEKREPSWGIPKGIIEDGEEIFDAAKREFKEETGIDPILPYITLPAIKNNSGKTIYIWAFKKDHNLELQPLISNTCYIEWPKKSGTIIEIPEICEGRYFTLEEAINKIFKYQYPLLVILDNFLKLKGGI